MGLPRDQQQHFKVPRDKKPDEEGVNFAESTCGDKLSELTSHQMGQASHAVDRKPKFRNTGQDIPCRNMNRQLSFWYHV